MKCIKCGSKELVKAGFVRGKQRYRCKSCHCHFTINAKSKPLEIKRAAIHLYLEGLSYGRIGKLLGVSDVAVYRWIKPFLNGLTPLRNTETKLLNSEDVYRALYVNMENFLFVSTFEKAFHESGKGGFSVFVNKKV